MKFIFYIYKKSQILSRPKNRKNGEKIISRHSSIKGGIKEQRRRKNPSIFQWCIVVLVVWEKSAN
jgi:hypothetical protein